MKHFIKTRQRRTVLIAFLFLFVVAFFLIFRFGILAETQKGIVNIQNDIFRQNNFTFSYGFRNRNKPYIFKYEPTFDFTYYNKTQPNTEIISVQKKQAEMYENLVFVLKKY